MTGILQFWSIPTFVKIMAVGVRYFIEGHKEMTIFPVSVCMDRVI